MATQVAQQSVELTQLVGVWERRRRLQRTLFWLPVSLLPGLLIGIVLALIAFSRPILASEQIAILSAALVSTGALTLVGLIWLRPRPPLVAARDFDLLFDLDERVSTALELLEGRIHAGDELTTRQLDDAHRQAQRVQPDEKIPLRWNRRGWLAVALGLVLLALLLLLPNPQTPATAQNTAQQAAIAEAEENLRQITQDIASNPTLDEQSREQVLQELNRTQEVLNEDSISPEEAFASLSDSEAQLQEQAERMQQSADQQRAALEQAANELRQASQQTEQTQQQQMQQQGSAEGQQDAAGEIQELSEQLSQMSESQRQEFADALEAAADALEATNPEAAQALRDAAEALRNNDIQAAQEALSEAAQQMQQQQQQTQAQQQSAEQMQQQAQQVQQSAQQIAQSGQQMQTQQQQSAEQMQQAQQAAQQQGQQGQGEEGEQGEQGQQGQEGQQGQQAMQGEQGQQSQQAMQGEQTGEQIGSQPSDESGIGGGAGDAQGDAGAEETTRGGNQQASIDNNPDGEGEGQFSEVYAPRRIGGEGEDSLVLEPDASDVPMQEGEFSENPAGQSLVPYNQVFSDYSNAATRALESDYIPLGMRDVVRDYFSSLEPGQRR